MKNLFLFVLFLLGLYGCNSSNVNHPNPYTPITLTIKGEQMAHQDNAFALALLKHVESFQQSSSYFVSPLSVSFALGMAYNGAADSTRDAIASTLSRNGYTDEEINAYYQQMSKALLSADNSIQLSLANAIWTRQGFEVLDAFYEVNQTYYQAECRTLDFTRSESLDVINAWCSEKTKGKIPQILTSIPDNAVMYLMNAVYFKGLWTEPFNASNNRVATFSPERSTDVNLTYMCMDARQFAYTQDSQVQIAEFPYGNGAFSMLIVLPKSGIAIDDILTDLNTQKWSDWTRALTETILNVQIPKFTFNYELNLNRILSDMGMSIAFDANRANFSRINPADRLFLTEVKQKAYVSVDEKGTEAAAVTSIGVGVTSMPIATSFIANHSFLFFIREKSTGIILFAGKYGG